MKKRQFVYNLILLFSLIMLAPFFLKACGGGGGGGDGSSSNGNGDTDYKLTTEEALLSAAQDSSEFNDTLNYAGEMGYTGALENVIEYPILGESSVFMATITDEDGKMTAIVYDPRTQPVFLPAYLIIPENEDTFRLITRNGGLLFENATSTDGPQVSAIDGESRTNFIAKLSSQQNTDCKNVFRNFLDCLAEESTDIQLTLPCTFALAVCTAPLIYQAFYTGGLDINAFVACTQQYAMEPCGELVADVLIYCFEELKSRVPCDDQDDCTPHSECNWIGQCVGVGPAITDCIDDDGCCPSGCNYLNDSDCETEGVWELAANGVVTGATENCGCCGPEGAQPGECGTELNGPFGMGDPDIHVQYLDNSVYASEGDVNGVPFVLEGTISGNLVTFKINGNGITPCIGNASTTYNGTLNENMITGNFTGYGECCSEDEEGNVSCSYPTWSGTFTVTIK